MSRQELGCGVWYDADQKGYIMLDATDAIPRQSSQTIDGVELFPKDEYHCSLVAARKLAGEDRALETQLVDDVREYLGRHTVEFAGLNGEYYFCQKTNSVGETEYTLIGGVEVIGLESLRATIQRRSPEYQPPFPHITLLRSANSKYGIGVNSEEDLRAYCIKIESYES